MRRATAADGAEVVRLAELMYVSLGAELPDRQWATWRAAAGGAVAAVGSAEPPGRAASVVFVVDHPGEPGRLAACGAGVVYRRLPNPWHPDGLTGYVQWMSTDTALRRRGLGRAVLRALLEWFEASGVDNVELHATPEGVPLYRSEGFWRGSGGLPMRRRAWDLPPAGDA